MAPPSTDPGTPGRRGWRLLVLSAASMVVVSSVCAAASRTEALTAGRIPGYQPDSPASVGGRPMDVPKGGPEGGLSPGALLATYDATPLAAAGFTGKQQTVVFFEWADYNQDDLSTYQTQMLPTRSGTPFAPKLVNVLDNSDFDHDADSVGETELDVEAVHAIAPDAQLVIVNAGPALVSDATGKHIDPVKSYEQVQKMFGLVDRQYPHAVWSSSIGWTCDRGLDQDATTQLSRVQDALQGAETHGTSAFDASGDNGGLECKEDNHPPAPGDRGLDAVASLPGMTDVGGTTLSTDANAGWVTEEVWGDSVLSQGTGGGVSNLWSRPVWQNTVSAPEDTSHRLVPDVAADADPSTGAAVCGPYDPKQADSCWQVVGGTSLAAPIWAGLTALMDQYLIAHGGHALGDLNPQLYQVAAHGALPAFHDVALGGNAVYNSRSGYDLVSGLGTPDVNNLAADLLNLQQGHG